MRSTTSNETTEPDQIDSEPRLVARSPAMRRLMGEIEVVGAAEAPVLILGETGSGKDLVARAVHAASPRAQGPLISVNSAAIPDTLLEAELFGYQRGAFAGADRSRSGRFRAADGGTLFLDEVGELPARTQARLLRVLQERSYEPLGANRSYRVEARLVYSTNRDLQQLVAERLFREDLYYRIRVLELRVPPLRERREDIPELVETFLRRAGAPAIRLAPEVEDILVRYRFPGNVRELEHAITHGVVLARGTGVIEMRHLPGDLVQRAAKADATAPGAGVLPLSEVVARAEREAIARALDIFHGQRGLAADALDVSRKTLWEKVRHYGIETASLGDGRSWHRPRPAAVAAQRVV